MKSFDGAIISTGIAHVLAWVAALLLAFGPVYQGVSVSPVMPGQAGGETTKTTSSTFIEGNGLRVLPVVLAPVVLTGLALFAVLLTHAGQATRKVLLWASAVLLLGFCGLGSASIGVFYLPAALALVLSAILGSRSPPRTV